jgi:hypothetical protein
VADARFPQDRVGGHATVHVLLDGSRALSTADPAELRGWIQRQRWHF